ncbi:hypothetical protein G6F66_001128 [Rhizopus arrhizus]|nr:hypothetical protein G6F66_001128 [Rhizopus arrhizus]
MNKEEEEAGSILISLANQRSHPIRRNKSMSIQNLLENKEKSFYKQDSQWMEQHDSTQRSLLFENQSDNSSTPSTPPSSYLFKTNEFNLSVNEMMNGHMQPSYYPMHQITKRSHPQLSRMKKGKHQESLVSTAKFVNAPYLNMKQRSKLRRNALQAYISYMIYADITRQKKPSSHFNIPSRSLDSILNQPLTAFLHSKRYY